MIRSTPAHFWRLPACLLALGLASPAGALEFVNGGPPAFTQAATGEGGSGLAVASNPWNFPGFTASGLDTRLGPGLMLGVSSQSATSDFTLGGLSRGVDFSTTSVKLGYQLGNLTPFVSTSVTTLKPSAIPGLSSGFNTTGDLLAGQSDPKSKASVGAGFNYALTDNFHVGVGASFSNAR